MTNTEMLQRVIDDSGLKRNAILEMMGFKAYSTLREKIENRREFTASEIIKLSEILNLTNDQREAIFFAKVAESYSA
jgi:ferritin-like metal-binding protein YciE